MQENELITMIINALIIFINIILIIIYIKNKAFHHYSFYCNLLLLIVILLNNIVRIFQTLEKNSKLNKFICYGQAILLSFSDSLILLIISMISSLAYFSVINKEYYKLHEKSIFLIFFFISLLISIILPIIYLFIDSPIKTSDHYCCPKDNEFNRIIYFSFTTLLLCLNVYNILSMLFYFSDKKKFHILHEGQNKLNYNYIFITLFLMLFSDGLLFFIILLKIDNILLLQDNDIDLWYILSCFIVEIFYCINKKILNLLLNIITCRHLRNENNDLQEHDSEREVFTGSEGIFSDLNLND